MAALACILAAPLPGCQDSDTKPDDGQISGQAPVDTGQDIPGSEPVDGDSGKAGEDSGQDAEEEAVPERKTVTCGVIEDKSGAVKLDGPLSILEDAGYAFGDSVDIRFSNGFSMEDVPYFDGYYVRRGLPVIAAHHRHNHVRVLYQHGDSLWEASGVSDSDTIEVSLHEAGKYAAVMKNLSMEYSDERDDYGSDEEFANFREIRVGNIAEGRLYRSASPVDNRHNRAATASALLEGHGIGFVLDLSDSREEVASDIEENKRDGVDTSAFEALLDNDKVAFANLSTAYTKEKFAKSFAKALRQMSSHDGPYLLHCVEGKDRTGFACLVLESLAGATYQEMLDDYMVTYKNYYGIDKAGEPGRYDAVASIIFDDMAAFLVGNDPDLTSADYAAGARRYLSEVGGMSEEEINGVVSAIS